MTSKSSVDRLLAPVLAWLAGTREAWESNLEYWRIRRELMGEGEAFDGPAGPILSNIDTAMDAFSPEPDRDPDQIDEAQLRSEVEAALARLKALGLVE